MSQPYCTMDCQSFRQIERCKQKIHHFCLNTPTVPVLITENGKIGKFRIALEKKRELQNGGIAV